MKTQRAIIESITQLKSNNINQLKVLIILFLISSFQSHQIESKIQLTTIKSTQASAVIAVNHLTICHIIDSMVSNQGLIVHVYKFHIYKFVFESFTLMHHAPGIFSVTFTVIDSHVGLFSLVDQVVSAKTLDIIENKNKTKENILSKFFIVIC
jgi:hypothetical protein